MWAPFDFFDFRLEKKIKAKAGLGEKGRLGLGQSLKPLDARRHEILNLAGDRSLLERAAETLDRMRLEPLASHLDKRRPRLLSTGRSPMTLMTSSSRHRS
jgi:hypothetical protein